MPTDLVVIAAGIALIVALLLAGRAVARRRHPSPGQVHRPGPFEPFVNVLDASVLMYGIRSALGRPTETARERREAEALRQVEIDELARRIGASGAWGAPSHTRPSRLVVAGTAASHDGQRPRSQQAHPPGAVPAARPSPRIRLARDSAVALLGIAVLIGAVSVFGGGDDDGAVLDAVGTPADSIPPAVTEASPTADGMPSGEPSEAAASPSPDGAAATQEARTRGPSATTSAATGAATTTPRATRTPRPTATPRSAVTPRPTSTPTPTGAPTATPKPIVTPAPTPEPTAEPTADPTAEPTPDATPEADVQP